MRELARFATEGQAFTVHGRKRGEVNGNRKRTVLGDLPRPALQQQPHSSSSRFDDFYRSGVCHIPRALPIDFNDLISYLFMKEI